MSPSIRYPKPKEAPHQQVQAEEASHQQAKAEEASHKEAPPSGNPWPRQHNIREPIKPNSTLEKRSEDHTTIHTSESIEK